MPRTFALFASRRLAPLGPIFAADAARPTTVFIFAEDRVWGDLSCHGTTRLKRPSLDRLAGEGIDLQPFNVLGSARNGMRGTLRHRPSPAAMLFPSNPPPSARGTSQAPPV